MSARKHVEAAREALLKVCQGQCEKHDLWAACVVALAQLEEALLAFSEPGEGEARVPEQPWRVLSTKYDPTPASRPTKTLREEIENLSEDIRMNQVGGPGPLDGRILSRLSLMLARYPEPALPDAVLELGPLPEWQWLAKDYGLDLLHLLRGQAPESEGRTNLILALEAYLKELGGGET